MPITSPSIVTTGESGVAAAPPSRTVRTAALEAPGAPESSGRGRTSFASSRSSTRASPQSIT